MSLIIITLLQMTGRAIIYLVILFIVTVMLALIISCTWHDTHIIATNIACQFIITSLKIIHSPLFEQLVQPYCSSPKYPTVPTLHHKMLFYLHAFFMIANDERLMNERTA